MPVKALDLFKAYAQSSLPTDGGYIVSSFFSEGSAYTRYEVIAYPSVKALYLSEEGLTFQSDGNKLYALVEPASYPRKFIEPFRRDNRERIPQRFSELTILTTKNQTKIMVSKSPIMTFTSFTVFKPIGTDFAFVFLRLPDALESLESFFAQSLHREAGVPTSEAARAASLVVDTVGRFTVFDAAPQQHAEAPRPSPATPAAPAARKPRALAKPKAVAKRKAASKAKPKAVAKRKAAPKAKPKAVAKRKAAPKAKPKAVAKRKAPSKAKPKAVAKRKAATAKVRPKGKAKPRPNAR